MLSGQPRRAQQRRARYALVRKSKALPETAHPPGAPASHALPTRPRRPQTLFVPLGGLALSRYDAGTPQRRRRAVLLATVPRRRRARVPPPGRGGGVHGTSRAGTGQPFLRARLGNSGRLCEEQGSTGARLAGPGQDRETEPSSGRPRLGQRWPRQDGGRASGPVDRPTHKIERHGTKVANDQAHAALSPPNRRGARGLLPYRVGRTRTSV